MKTETVKLLHQALAEELEALKLKREHVRRESFKPGPWCSREQASRYFALPKGALNRWVIEGKVIAKKFDVEDPNSAIRFKTADIYKAYEQMPNYKFEVKRNNHTIKDEGAEK